MIEPVCTCLCHLGIRPTKGEVKEFKRNGIVGTDPVGIATACSQCAQRHAECLDGARVCECGHTKFGHTTDDGCAGSFEEFCRCLAFKAKS